MRILIINQLFDPEPSLLLGLNFARRLRGFGHEVQVLTCFPNYPTGKVYPGYRMRLWQRETMDGVEVLRVPHYPSHDRSAIKRVCSYLSLACSQAILGPWLVRRPDVVFVPVGPMTLNLPALWYRWLWGTPFLLDVQDLWPESVTGSGMLRARWAERLISRCCTFVYRRASRMVVLSEGYKRLLVERGASAEDVSVIYNWCDPSHEQRDFRAPAPDTFGLKGWFNLVYTGNLGELQALESVVRAALMVKDRLPNVRFVLVGGGTREGALRQMAEAEGASNVRFISRLPLDRLGEVLHFASLVLVHLKRHFLSEVGIPQKVQAYMAAGIPILAAVRGEAAGLVERSGGGFLCEPESPASIAEAVDRLHRLSPDELRSVGQRGLEYYQRNLCFEVGVRRLVEALESTVSCAVSGGRR